MKKWQKEIEGILLDDEEEVLRKLEKTYQQSLKDVQAHAKQLQNDIDKLIADDPDNENQIRAKVYQLQYQQALEKQINGYMDVIKDKNTKDISDYLNTVYSDGFMTQQYALMNEGVNVTMPINQKMLVKSVTYKTEDIPLSTRIYKNVEKAKKTIVSEISRGLSTGMSNADISRNLKNAMGVSSRKAWQLAQNEGARVRQDAITDVGNEAKKRGADVVKQWSATLDGKTRPVHAELDEKWAELDEDFEYSGGTVSAPKKFGIASLDINCRCSLLIVPRWDVEGNKSSLRRDNETKELVRVRDYRDWYNNTYSTTVKSDESLQYMSNPFRPTYSKQTETVKVTRNETKIRKVTNSDFNLYAEEGHTRRSKAVRQTEKLLTEISETLPDDFEIPRTVVLDFDLFGNDAIGGYNKATNTMYINSKYNTEEKMLKYLKEQEGLFANTTVYAPIKHELGHKYYYDIVEKYSKSKNISYNEAEQTVNDKIADYVHKRNANGDFLKKELSEYAQDGYSLGKYGEVVAESFSAIDTNDVAKEIIELLRGLLL